MNTCLQSILLLRDWGDLHDYDKYDVKNSKISFKSHALLLAPPMLLMHVYLPLFHTSKKVDK